MHMHMDMYMAMYMCQVNSTYRSNLLKRRVELARGGSRWHEVASRWSEVWREVVEVECHLATWLPPRTTWILVPLDRLEMTGGAGATDAQVLSFALSPSRNRGVLAAATAERVPTGFTPP